MTDSTGRQRFDAVDRTITLSLLLVIVAACSKDSTAPTPVATTVSLVGGSAQTAVVGTSLAAPVVVKVTDQSGNPLAGVAVVFSPSTSAGSVSAAQVTTDATGSAQVAWTLGTLAGTDSMTVTAGSLTPLAVIATATPGAPAALAIVAGNNQSAPVDSTLSAVLAVKVADQYGNGIPNATVQWSDDAGGTFAASTTVTDVNGIAQVGYTLGPTAGPEDVVATLLNAATPMSASFTEIGN
jgi:protocatechuate 3,4-dioxygenase beta subunit